MKTTNHPFLVSLVNNYQNNSHLFFVIVFAKGGDLSFHLAEKDI